VYFYRSLSLIPLVLPEVTLNRIERHVIDIAAERVRLKAAGQHLKRGVLLYGPPGTGKTHTVRYLLSRQRDVTAFVLSGQALALVAQVCGLARLLQPSIVILEDIDLIAPDRSFGPLGTSPLLFEVLNQIDGLDDDVDVTFLLTTNRVDILERALAERPGRVDAAVEIGPPDSVGRARLFRLYGNEVGLGDMSDEDLAEAVGATDGRTATYLREVVRRAVIATAALNETGALRVDVAALIEAATGLAEDHVLLSRSLFGGDEEADADAVLAGRPPWGPINVARMMHSRGWVGYGPRGGPPPRPFGPEE
jgi:ATP-dependent 26S proteasome regulatory subunit